MLTSLSGSVRQGLCRATFWPAASRAAGLTPWCKPTQRSASTTGQELLLTSIDETGVATMRLNRRPVNSLNLEFLTEINMRLDRLHLDSACRGLILTSANDGIFSAGLDILEMYNPDESRLREFWRSLQDMWLQLYTSRLVTIAAINGHSPAGGCLLSISCDYRIMAEGKFTIGLNETKLGITAPSWFVDTMLQTVGHRECERALQLGSLYKVDDALRIGLIDEVKPMADVLPTAQATMKEWLKIPAAARYLSKLALRSPASDKLQRNKQADIDQFVNLILKDSVQKGIGMYLDALKKKSAK